MRHDVKFAGSCAEQLPESGDRAEGFFFREAPNRVPVLHDAPVAERELRHKEAKARASFARDVDLHGVELRGAEREDTTGK